MFGHNQATSCHSLKLFALSMSSWLHTRSESTSSCIVCMILAKESPFGELCSQWTCPSCFQLHPSGLPQSIARGDLQWISRFSHSPLLYWDSMPLPACLLSRHLIVLHLFSGHRRPGVVACPRPLHCHLRCCGYHLRFMSR